jgi:hypothetical protein
VGDGALGTASDADKGYNLVGGSALGSDIAAASVMANASLGGLDGGEALFVKPLELGSHGRWCVRVEIVLEVAMAKLVRCGHKMAEAIADAGIDRFVSPTGDDWRRQSGRQS